MSAEQAYADGFQAGQSPLSGSNSWHMSVHVVDYCRGFTDGSNTYLGKLRLGRLSYNDRKAIEWQREHMDAVDGNGEFRDPTDEDAAIVLDGLDAEEENVAC